MGRLLLVLGGARSGKSAYAQRLAQELGGDTVLFVATARRGTRIWRSALHDIGRNVPRLGGPWKHHARWDRPSLSTCTTRRWYWSIA